MVNMSVFSQIWPNWDSIDAAEGLWQQRHLSMQISGVLGDRLPIWLVVGMDTRFMVL
jgi:hypothetical protein